MTVEELRALLKDYDASAIVAIRAHGLSYEEISDITVMDMVPVGEVYLRPAAEKEMDEAATCVVLG